MRFWPRKPSRPPTPTFEAPLRPETAFFVVGDIHGCDTLFCQLLERFAALAHPTARLVLVGDYVDRGDYSAEVLRRLHRMQAAVGPEEMICLRGNHDQMLLDFLDDPKAAGPRWFRHGGLQTLGSYGLPGVAVTAPDQLWLDLRDRLREAMGQETETWLRGLPLSWQSGNVFVCHAGADPGCPVANQTAHTLLWGHPAFETTPRTDGNWVVHGHTITEHARPHQGRIPVDTGAYATGRLTGALLESGKVQFHASSDPCGAGGQP